MRRAARVDDNQAKLVKELRAMGYEVIHLHSIGRGVPDLLVSNKEHIWLVEVKMPKQKLNSLQEAWHGAWRGKPPIVASSAEEFLRLAHLDSGV